jgi:hypothetical protein
MAGEPGPLRPRSRRFWILAVAAAVILIAGLAVLLERAYWSHKAFLETSAVAAMKQYAAEQEIYKKTDWDGDGKFVYADTLDKLAAVGLIDKEFAQARGRQGKPWRGYLFLEMKTIGGAPIDWSSDYALCAIPARYGVTGYRTFITKIGGPLCGRDCGCDGGPVGFVEDYPADVVGTGWLLPD